MDRIKKISSILFTVGSVLGFADTGTNTVCDASRMDAFAYDDCIAAQHGAKGSKRFEVLRIQFVHLPALLSHAVHPYNERDGQSVSKILRGSKKGLGRSRSRIGYAPNTQSFQTAAASRRYMPNI